ncbi:hypothetical protein BaRGS_00001666 [Batillaria attramentaria]|uniref:Uncharacterized protein n=1 Tax=Batillaria attramentaria TaxID=370345 RepID=A0ABD0M561_9CAEN
MMILETDNTEEHVLDASGVFYQDIEKDTDGSSSLDESGALEICLAYNLDERLVDDITHVKVGCEFHFNSCNYSASRLPSLVEVRYLAIN